jgi:hypothetical protein
MDELTGPGALVAADLFAGCPVEAIEPRAVVADEHPVDGRGVEAEPVGDAVRPDLVQTPAAHDGFLDSRRRPRGLAVRTARAVEQALFAELLVAAPPLVGALAGDPHGRSHVGDRRAGLDPLAEEQSTLGGERSVTVIHEDLREVVLASTPAHLHPEVFVLVDQRRVTNVSGKYT